MTYYFTVLSRPNLKAIVSQAFIKHWMTQEITNTTKSILYVTVTTPWKATNLFPSSCCPKRRRDETRRKNVQRHRENCLIDPEGSTSLDIFLIKALWKDIFIRPSRSCSNNTKRQTQSSNSDLVKVGIETVLWKNYISAGKKSDAPRDIVSMNVKSWTFKEQNPKMYIFCSALSLINVCLPQQFCNNNNNNNNNKVCF